MAALIENQKYVLYENTCVWFIRKISAFPGHVCERVCALYQERLEQLFVKVDRVGSIVNATRCSRFEYRRKRTLLHSCDTIRITMLITYVIPAFDKYGFTNDIFIFPSRLYVIFQKFDRSTRRIHVSSLQLKRLLLVVYKNFLNLRSKTWCLKNDVALWNWLRFYTKAF